MITRFFLLLALFTFSISAYSQKGDPILFSVEGSPVHWSEFEYIYSKTNGADANFSKESLEEYLDLYVNFKLKVKKAQDMKLDTIVSLQQELNGYRRQLADSYLIDREVTEKLVNEAFKRKQEDLEISHILIKLAPNALPEDTVAALAKITEAQKLLEMGRGFDEVAKTCSEDESVKKNGGKIGWVTSIFPNGFYELETAAFEAQTGKVFGPVRTALGYHLAVVHNRRPARGEVEVAHILIRADKNPDQIKARKKIDEAYEKLQSGVDFNEVAKEFSEDKMTASKGGYLGYFGINRYEKSFEDAAFELVKDGDYCKPVQTTIGWHIIKRIGKKEISSLPKMKAALQNQIKSDQRFELAKESMVERIKVESNFTENRTTLSSIISSLQADTSNTFLTYKWKAPNTPTKGVLFTLGDDMKISAGDFENYMQRSSRIRQQMARQGIEAVVLSLYKDYIAENALKYEEKQLESKYPEFKSLMREYEEGVLLFEVTKMEVWDKASQDTSGLKAFYEQNKNKYQWDDRAVVSEYSLVSTAEDQINKIREYCKDKSPEEVLAQFNGDGPEPILSYRSKTYEKGRNEMLDKMDWKIGQLSPVKTDKRSKALEFFKIEDLLTPDQKSLQEARGYVVADYQDHLEKKWLESLKKEYEVDVNNKVLNKKVNK